MKAMKWINLGACGLNCAIIYTLPSAIDGLLIFTAVMNFGVFLQLAIDKA